MKKTYQKPALTATALLQGFQLCAASGGIIADTLGDDSDLVEKETEVLSKQYSSDLWEDDEE